MPRAVTGTPQKHFDQATQSHGTLDESVQQNRGTMTRADWEQLDRTVAEMTDADKRHLIERVARSLNSGHTDSADVMTAEQRQAVLDALEEVKNLPHETEPDDGIVASEDHDAVLYDGTSSTGFPEKPIK